MESLYLLIPLVLIFLALALKVLFWAIKSGQYDDLGAEGQRILFDEDRAPSPEGTVLKSEGTVLKPEGNVLESKSNALNSENGNASTPAGESSEHSNQKSAVNRDNTLNPEAKS